MLQTLFLIVALAATAHSHRRISQLHAKLRKGSKRMSQDRRAQEAQLQDLNARFGQAIEQGRTAYNNLKQQIQSLQEKNAANDTIDLSDEIAGLQTNLELFSGIFAEAGHPIDPATVSAGGVAGSIGSIDKGSANDGLNQPTPDGAEGQAGTSEPAEANAAATDPPTGSPPAQAAGGSAEPFLSEAPQPSGSASLDPATGSTIGADPADASESQGEGAGDPAAGGLPSGILIGDPNSSDSGAEVEKSNEAQDQPSDQQ